MKYTIFDLYTDVALLYEAVNTTPFKRVELPVQLYEFGSLIEDVFEQKFISYKEVDPVSFKPTNSVGVAFSGGKDSAALAFHLRGKGYNVTLYHLTGVNAAYPDEKKFAENFAKKYGFRVMVLTTLVKPSKGSFVENIVKNNLILLQCLAHGVTFGITNVGLGCATGNTSMLKDYGFSDSNQNLSSFARGVEALFGYKIFVEEIESEGQSYKILFENNVDFADIVSCMMPIRYRGKLNTRNIKKGLFVRPSGCGQCYKCAMDYFYMGVNDVESDKHYIDILRRHWNHIFAEKPCNVKDLISGVLNKNYINVDNVLGRLIDSGVDIYAKV